MSLTLADFLAEARSLVAGGADPASVSRRADREGIRVRVAGVRPPQARPTRSRRSKGRRAPPKSEEFPALGASRREPAPRPASENKSRPDYRRARRLDLTSSETPAGTLPEGGRRRAILTNGGRKRSALLSECNGVIVDADTWQPLSVPPRAFVRSPPHATVNRHLEADLYDVIVTNDATVVTLYPWSPDGADSVVWCLSSGNGYDVSALRWMGELTFAETLFSLLERIPEVVETTGARLVRGVLGPDDVRLEFDSLDAGRCYTVGFRHHNFHPLVEDPEGVWNIQSVELKSLAASREVGVPGLPQQVVVDDVREFLGLAPEAPVRVADLLAWSEGALSAAEAAIAAEDGKAQFNYGLILRSRDPAKTPGCSDVLLESDLLRAVKRSVYGRPSHREASAVSHKNRLEFQALRAYLSPSERAGFIALFPRLQPRFARFAEFIGNLVRAVTLRARGRKLDMLDRPPTSQVQALAETLLRHIESNVSRFDVASPEATNIITAYVVQPSYASLYLSAIPRG